MAAEDLCDMTTEDDEARTMIRNNGAIPPLVRLLDSNVCFFFNSVYLETRDELLIHRKN